MPRAAQLAAVGINARVFTNQGPKGPALKTIIDEYCADSRAVHRRFGAAPRLGC